MKLYVFSKYYKRILLWIFAAIIACISAFFVTVYVNAGRGVQRIQYDNSQKIFRQIKNSFDNMNALIKSIISSLSENPEIKNIMYNPNLNDKLGSGIVSMYRVDKTLIGMMSLINSVYVYNPYTGRFYSSYYSSPSRGFLFEDKGLEELLSGFRQYPKLTPIYRVMDKKDGGGQYFTYLWYDDMKNGAMNGGIAVNINAGYFFSSFKAVFGNAPDSGARVFLVTKGGRYIGENGYIDNDAFISGLSAAVPGLYENGKASREGGYIKKISGKNYIVSFAYLSEPDMLLAETRPYSAIENDIQALRNGILLVFAIFLLVTAIVAVSVSRWIYDPLKSLVQRVGANSPAQYTGEPNDEITFLNDVYNGSMDMLTKYREGIHSYERIFKDIWFRQLLNGSSEEGGKFPREKLARYGFTADHALFAACLFRIDNYEEFERDTSKEDQDLVKFAIANISSEIFSECFVNYAAALDDDKAAVLMAARGMEDADGGKIADLAGAAIRFLLEKMKISVTAAISSFADTAEHIPSCYEESVENSAYRFIFGANSVITPEKTAENKANSCMDFLFKNEDGLTDAIRSGSRANVEAALDKAVDEVSSFMIRNITISMIHLTYTVMDAVHDTQKGDARVSAREFGDLLRNISEIETSAEFKRRLMECLGPYLSLRDGPVVNEKYKSLAEAVISMINADYGDFGLCLNKIAEYAKMSGKHLNNIFKMYTNCSIPEYINNVRLQKSEELLRKTELNINEIADKVGIANHTYFFSLFKKKYGMPPKTYRMSAILKDMNAERQGTSCPHA